MKRRGLEIKQSVLVLVRNGLDYAVCSSRKIDKEMTISEKYVKINLVTNHDE